MFKAILFMVVCDGLGCTEFSPAYWEGDESAMEQCETVSARITEHETYCVLQNPKED